MNAATAASLVASFVAVDPLALGGAVLHSPVHPARDRWLQILKELMPSAAAIRRVPFNIPDDRLFGGLDLAATLKTGRPVAEKGILNQVQGGVLVISMAERTSAHTAASICTALDRADLAVVALDEGIADESVPRALLDRLAFIVDLGILGPRENLQALHEPADIVAARDLLPQVAADSALVETLCATAHALGAGSLRISVLALRVARISAALDGRRQVNEEDAVLAGRLVLAPRASQLPQEQRGAEEQPESSSDANNDDTAAEQPEREAPSAEAQNAPGFK